MFTCPILAGKRGLRGTISQVRLLWLPEAPTSRKLAAATTRLWLRRMLLRPILGLCLQQIRLLVFTARLCFRIFIWKKKKKYVRTD